MTASTCPMGSETMSVGSHPSGVHEQSRRLARELQSGGLPESEGFDLGQQALLVESLGDLGRTDVGGLGQDLGGGEGLGRVGFGVVEGRAVELQGVGHVEHGVGLISPSWSAAENVTSLKTDPGS